MFKVLTNLSNRHIHLTDEDVEALFGAGHTLTRKVDLLQPGAFAANECVSITGPAGTVERVRVVGPTRPATQCEILTGDTYRLGYKPADVPVRLSGEVDGSAAFTITGPAGSIEKNEGLIIAQRHIHISPELAVEHELSNKQSVILHCDTPDRKTDFHGVIIRVQPGASLECHIDTEEGNAAGIGNGYAATVVV
ncbi:MAG: putative phosphotransacetylase [Candidatus Paceibacteria bacterium]|jgi:putative phosphotransacetylase